MYFSKCDSKRKLFHYKGKARKLEDGKAKKVWIWSFIVTKIRRFRRASQISWNEILLLKEQPDNFKSNKTQLFKKGSTQQQHMCCIPRFNQLCKCQCKQGSQSCWYCIDKEFLDSSRSNRIFQKPFATILKSTSECKDMLRNLYIGRNAFQIYFSNYVFFS